MDDVLGRGGQDVLTKIRIFPENRSGTLKVRESAFVRVGVELSHGGSSLAKLTQDAFSGGSETPRFLTGTLGCTAADIPSRSHQVAPVQAGGVLLVGHSFKTGH